MRNAEHILLKLVRRSVFLCQEVRLLVCLNPLQSFSSAIHHLYCLTDFQVDLFFRAEDGRIALSGIAKLSRSYPGVDSKRPYRKGDILYCCG